MGKKKISVLDEVVSFGGLVLLSGVLLFGFWVICQGMELMLLGDTWWREIAIAYFGGIIVLGGFLGWFHWVKYWRGRR